MQTIRIPKNLLFLSDKLPQPNYERNKKTNINSSELPDIRQINNRKKQKIKDNLQENIDSSIIESLLNPQVNSIKKKHHNRENSNNNPQLNISNLNQLDEENLGIKINERREKSPM